MSRSLIHIGTSGWSYPHWNQIFYPEKIKDSAKLAFYSMNFKTVEVNTTFYHFPRETSLINWKKRVPKDFIFSVKAYQFITHLKRLKPTSTTNFFLKQLRLLGPKLGPVLFQLPPSFKLNLERLEEFLKDLDDDLHYTFEFRNPSWYTDDLYELLKKYNVALCITDLGGNLSPIEITADFTYIRLHGPQNAYQGSYGTKRLNVWKDRILEFTDKKKKCYCYFDNDEKAYAVQDAKTLISLLSPRKFHPQGV